jgi:hypothetical protein
LLFPLVANGFCHGLLSPRAPALKRERSDP